MNGLHRTSPLATLTFAVVGTGAGLLLQFVRSANGMGPLVPPLSLAFTMIVIAVVLITLGIALRRAVMRKSGKAVNPFHAVRLLAAAKAAQFSGALLGGFGAGLALQLLTRTIMAPTSSWVPMGFVFAAGIVLVVCGIITETLCRVPPGDPEDEAERSSREPEAGVA